jgi:hypothetical protein
MENKKNIIRKYFESWVNKDINIIEKYFSENIKYIQIFGTEHNKKEQVYKLFIDAHSNGNIVIKWDIKRIIEEKNVIAVEWHFEGIYNIYKIGFDLNDISFDGVSIIEFDENNKIIFVREYPI